MGPLNLFVRSDVIVIGPERLDPVVDVLQVAVLPETWERVVEAFQSVLQGLVHPLDEVIPFLTVGVVLQPGPPASLGIPVGIVVQTGLRPYLSLSSLRKR